MPGQLNIIITRETVTAATGFDWTGKPTGVGTTTQSCWARRMDLPRRNEVVLADGQYYSSSDS